MGRSARPGVMGRPRKYGQGRMAQIKLPASLHQQLVVEAERRGVPLTDLGAAYLLAGANAARAATGQPPLPVPGYLTGLSATVFVDGLGAGRPQPTLLAS